MSGDRFSVSVAGEGEMATCWAIRRNVFVEGQGVSEEIEVDGRDAECTHFLIRDAESGAVGTARLRKDGAAAKVERVAVLAAERGRGAGRVLMNAIEDFARRAGHSNVKLAAQETVIEFYLRLGYAPVGAKFMEAGIVHQYMVKALR